MTKDEITKDEWTKDSPAAAVVRVNSRLGLQGGRDEEAWCLGDDDGDVEPSSRCNQGRVGERRRVGVGERVGERRRVGVRGRERQSHSYSKR